MPDVGVAVGETPAVGVEGVVGAGRAVAVGEGGKEMLPTVETGVTPGSVWLGERAG